MRLIRWPCLGNPPLSRHGCIMFISSTGTTEGIVSKIQDGCAHCHFWLIVVMLESNKTTTKWYRERKVNSNFTNIKLLLKADHLDPTLQKLEALDLLKTNLIRLHWKSMKELTTQNYSNRWLNTWRTEYLKKRSKHIEKNENIKNLVALRNPVLKWTETGTL